MGVVIVRIDGETIVASGQRPVHGRSCASPPALRPVQLRLGDDFVAAPIGADLGQAPSADVDHGCACLSGWVCVGRAGLRVDDPRPAIARGRGGAEVLVAGPAPLARRSISVDGPLADDLVARSPAIGATVVACCSVPLDHLAAASSAQRIELARTLAGLDGDVAALAAGEEPPPCAVAVLDRSGRPRLVDGPRRPLLRR